MAAGKRKGRERAPSKGWIWRFIMVMVATWMVGGTQAAKTAEGWDLEEAGWDGRQDWGDVEENEGGGGANSHFDDENEQVQKLFGSSKEQGRQNEGKGRRLRIRGKQRPSGPNPDNEEQQEGAADPGDVKRRITILAANITSWEARGEAKMNEKTIT